MKHPYYQSGKDQQREEAQRAYYQEALEYLKNPPPPLSGRVLESVSNTTH